MLLRTHFMIEKWNKAENKLLVQGHRNSSWEKCQWNQCIAASF